MRLAVTNQHGLVPPLNQQSDAPAHANTALPSPLDLFREFFNLIAGELNSLARDVHRIADVLDPPPADVVDSAYVAKRLGYKWTTWVAGMARNGEIPPSCIVPGTGNGKPWKFRRVQIEAWIESR